MRKTRVALAGLMACLMVPLAGAEQAFGYPTRPITIVAPFVAGGPTDRLARLLADFLGRELGQPVLIQNVGGSGGTLGARQVATAPSDGYTLLLHHVGMATAPALYRSLPYDPLTDFAPIGEVGVVAMTLVGRLDFAPDTLEELITYIRTHGAAVSYANAGVGSASQLCGMLFMDALETHMTVVEYPGTAPAISDILAGRIDMTCDQTPNTTNVILEGRVKAYAVSTEERLAVMPDLPTAIEAGLPGFNLPIWYGLYAPAGTAPEIISRLETALVSVLGDEELIARFGELGTFAAPAESVSAAALGVKLAREIEAWRTVIASADIYAD